MASDEIAVFNLERTVVYDVFGHVFDDARAGGLEVSSHVDSQTFSPRQQREAFLGWLANKDEAEIEPLLDVTTDKAAERLAPWAGLVMHAEAARGNELCLYSATVPNPLVNAYADGIEEMFPDVTIKYLFGKPLDLDEEGRFTGNTQDMLKGETIEQLQAQGHTIGLVADSFKFAFPAIKKAGHKLIVNPDLPLRQDPGFDRLKRLYWDSAEPAKTRIRLPRAERDRLYDLRDEAEQLMLLRALRYEV